MTQAELNAKVDAFVAKYNGVANIGTNASNNGECVGLCNVYWQELWGILYPLQGAATAYEILSKATNTRPDLFEKVLNNSNDLNQLPSKGDVMIWKNLAGGAGHCAIYLSKGSGVFTSFDQNWTARKGQTIVHDWNNVAGWIHNKTTSAPPVDPCASIRKDLTDTQNLLSKANVQIKNLTNSYNIVEAEKEKLQLANDKLNEDYKKAITDLEICIKDYTELQNHSWSWDEIWQLIINKLKGK